MQQNSARAKPLCRCSARTGHAWKLNTGHSNHTAASKVTAKPQPRHATCWPRHQRRRLDVDGRRPPLLFRSHIEQPTRLAASRIKLC
jgi:hypothetical protein